MVEGPGDRRAGEPRGWEAGGPGGPGGPGGQEAGSPKIALLKYIMLPKCQQINLNLT